MCRFKKIKWFFYLCYEQLWVFRQPMYIHQFTKVENYLLIAKQTQTHLVTWSILMKMETFNKDFQILINCSFLITICTIKSWCAIMVIITWVCCQKPLCVSSSLKTGSLHFWSEFWPGPAAERRRLERTAEPCPFLRPETEKHHAGH